jgi:hypothetical protein
VCQLKLSKIIEKESSHPVTGSLEQQHTPIFNSKKAKQKSFKTSDNVQRRTNEVKK